MVAAAGQSVVVVGAGMGGLVFATALAQLVRERGVAPPPRITVLERAQRTPYDAGSGGSGGTAPTPHFNYSLSLRADEAMPALTRIGARPAILAARTESEGFFVVNRDGRTLDAAIDVVRPHTAGGDDAADLRVDARVRRLDILRVLRDRVPSEGVDMQWGVEVVHLEQASIGGVEVHVRRDGGDVEVLHADLVVAADGNRSTVRALVCPHEQLKFTGAAFISGLARGVPVPSVTFRRHGVIFGNGSAMWLAHEGDDAVLWGIAFATDRPHPAGAASSASASGLRAEALARSAGYPPEVVALINASADATLRVVNCYDKAAHTSVASPPVVFIGDSTHPVTPFTGSGANLAIMDAWALAEALTSAATVPLACSNYDHEMVARSASVMRVGRWVAALVTTERWAVQAGRAILVAVLGWLFWFAGFTVSKRRSL